MNQLQMKEQEEGHVKGHIEEQEIKITIDSKIEEDKIEEDNRGANVCITSCGMIWSIITFILLIILTIMLKSKYVSRDTYYDYSYTVQVLIGLCLTLSLIEFFVQCPINMVVIEHTKCNKIFYFTLIILITIVIPIMNIIVFIYTFFVKTSSNIGDIYLAIVILDAIRIAFEYCYTSKTLYKYIK